MTLNQHRGGSGEPLVLLHGIGHTWRGFRPMLPRLEPHFDVLAVDLPGFGHSARFHHGTVPSPEALADSVAEAMDAAGFETAHMAGNSLGGWVALELARRGRARTCTAISPAGLAHGRENELARSVLLAMRWLARNSPRPGAAPAQSGHPHAVRRPDAWAGRGALIPMISSSSRGCSPTPRASTPPWTRRSAAR